MSFQLLQKLCCFQLLYYYNFGRLKLLCLIYYNVKYYTRYVMIIFRSDRVTVAFLNQISNDRAHYSKYVYINEFSIAKPLAYITHEEY